MSAASKRTRTVQPPNVRGGGRGSRVRVGRGDSGGSQQSKTKKCNICRMPGHSKRTCPNKLWVIKTMSMTKSKLWCITSACVVRVTGHQLSTSDSVYYRQWLLVGQSRNGFLIVYV